MTIKTREPDERFKAQVPDFQLEKRERQRRPKYRTWRDDPDTEEGAKLDGDGETPSKPVAEPIANPEQTSSKSQASDDRLGEVEPDSVQTSHELLETNDASLSQEFEINPKQTPSSSIENLNAEQESLFEDELTKSQANPKQDKKGKVTSPQGAAFKQTANPKQIPSKPIAEPIANTKQTGSKPKAEDLGTNEKPQAEPQAIGKQTPSNSCFSGLTGIQKTLIHIYYESIQLNGGQNTGPMTLEYLMEMTARDGNTLKDANQRLLKKQLLLRVDFKVGRGGWVVYSLPNRVREEVYRLQMVSKPQANPKQMVSKPIAEPQAEPQASISSSSIGSYYSESDPSDERIQKPPTPTTTLNQNGRILNKVEETDYSWITQIDIPVELKVFINESHLRQLARHGFGKAETKIVQTSIDNLNFAMILGHKYKNPAGLFLAAMKREGYVSPVESPEFNKERARKLMETDIARVEEAIQLEISKIALEKSSRPNQKRESLDDIPF
ncbi:MAG: hypothetical protein NTX25_00330 [Proteobacteria bacterium]|nr:hypothetical protein [Pseudomonadota bacterium]